jgi:hypothetical protein
VDGGAAGRDDADMNMAFGACTLFACALLGGLPAQGEPAKAGTPQQEPARKPVGKPEGRPVGILVLQKTPRSLNGEILRDLVHRTYDRRLLDQPPKDGRGDWVEINGNDAIVHVNSVLFRVVFGQKPWPIDVPEGSDAKDPVVAAERAQQAYMLLEAADHPTEPGERLRIYRTLAKLAAALLSDDSLALALVEFGEFRVMDAEAELALVAADPVAGFAPQGVASVVVLLKAARRPDVTRLCAAAGKTFAAEFVPAGTAGARHTVEVRGDAALVRNGDTRFILTFVDHRLVTVPLPADTEEQIKAVVNDHHAGMQIVSAGRFADAEQLHERYVELCHLLGQLWGEDCLGLRFQFDRVLILATDGTAAALQRPDPIAALKH